MIKLKTSSKIMIEEIDFLNFKNTDFDNDLFDIEDVQ